MTVFGKVFTVIATLAGLCFVANLVSIITRNHDRPVAAGIVTGLVLDPSSNKPSGETPPAPATSAQPSRPAWTVPIPDSVVNDESENHRVRVDPQSGKVLAVRSTPGSVFPLAPVCQVACEEKWSSANQIFDDSTTEDYAPSEDIKNLTVERLNEIDWWYAAPFKTTFYIRSKADGTFVQQTCIIDTANHLITILSTLPIGADGEASGPENVNATSVDQIAAVQQNLPISWAVGEFIHAVVDRQSMLRGVLR
jgi:hypothetical protein